MPTATEIEEKVFQIVSEQMSVEKGELSRETSFVNDLNADSHDTVELVMELEDEFDLTIPDEEAEKLKTVGNRQIELAPTCGCDGRGQRLVFPEPNRLG